MEYVKDLVAYQLRKEGYTGPKASGDIQDVSFDFTKKIGEDFVFCIALNFHIVKPPNFDLMYGVQPLIWTEKADLDRIGNLDCCFRNSLWELARFFGPHLFVENEYRDLLLIWELGTSQRQLDGAVADMLSAHQELSPKFFGQFEFPKPISSIVAEDFAFDYSNKRKKVGLRATPESAKLVARYYDSTHESGKVIPLCHWAIAGLNEIHATFPGADQNENFLSIMKELRLLLAKHGGRPH